MIRNVTFILLVILALLEFRFWSGNDSWLQVGKLKKTLQTQINENLRLSHRNQQISRDISNLKKDPLTIEEHARYELGMIKKGEIFYQVVLPLE